MSKKLEEIFDECIEQLRQGDSIENCLMKYPEVAAELEILLRTTVNVNWRSSLVRPRPEFKAYARAQFIGMQHAAAQKKQPSHRPTIFSLQRAWVPALTMVLILVLSSVGTAAAAADAMPDQPLYPVKLATEQVQLTLAFSNAAKVEVNVKLAETRSQEIAAMATQGKPEQVAVTTERLAQHLEAAEQAIIKVEETKARQGLSAPTTTAVPPSPSTATTPPPAPATPPPTTTTPQPTPPTPVTPPVASTQTPPPTAKVTVTQAEELRERLKETISKNVTAMENARDKSPEKTKAAIQKAIEMAKKRQTQLQQQKTTPATKPETTPVPPKPVPQEPRNPQNSNPSSTIKEQEPVKLPNTGTGSNVNPVPVTPTPTTPVIPKSSSDDRSSTGDTSKPASSVSPSTSATTNGTVTTTEK